ncbi:prepilin-type N-terminal cleavage/methylation domain-containing protein [Brytella acorum]|uniref:Prepilin-type N-terminal cleavage/methylation domain-containing protein n=1 Tax=Brytella acorum TaxID=2959299 RepID=A0AA35V5D5_9PROT|nr:prepilin-type N-terminal cleavage/methylation domain-containing protein [Brytella acorum]MDF3624769.1 prepilin-type N-terminal cleavage/methylation domain-containing protein [Brytella acorum]CAI9120072.1 prepilin-type N-terminal cleavage/methylation domain-containing protein [Brytella acorum]
MTGRRAEDGFSLLEILVVLAILGLALALLAHGRAWRSDTTDLRGALGTVARIARAARESAVVTQRPVRLGIDPAHHVVSAEGPDSVRESLPRCVTLASDGESDTTREVRFLAGPDGLFSRQVLSLTCGAHRGSVRFDPITGRVSIDEH